MTTTLDALLGRLRALTLKRGGLAYGLWGEAGVGKTFAVRRLLAQAGCRSLSVQASQPPQATMLALPQPRKLAAWLEEALRRLQAGNDTLGTPELLTSLLSANSPYVLHVEDLHEASEANVVFWQQVAGLVSRSRGVGLLLTSRTQPPQDFECVRLEPQDQLASDEMLEAEVGAKLPREAKAWIWQRAAGNPLFTLEYLRFLARQGYVWNDAHAWRWREPEMGLLPATVEVLIEQQLSGATQQAHAGAVLDALALLQARNIAADSAFLATLTGLNPDDLSQTVQQLAGQGILAGDRFAHPLFAELHLAKLSPERRQQLAEQVIGILLPTRPVEAAAFVGDAGWGAAQARVVYAQAAASSTGVAAARWQARVVECSSGPAQAQLAFETARALETAEPQEALRLAQLAVQLEPKRSDMLLYLAGRLVQVRRRLDDADEVLAQLDPAVRASTAFQEHQVGLRMACSDYSGALAIWEELSARPAFKAAPATLYAVAGSMAQLRRFDEADQIAVQVLAMPGLTVTQRVSLLNIRNIASVLAGRTAQAEECFAQAIALAREGGLHQQLGVLLQNRAKTLERSANLVEAKKASAEAIQAYLAAGDLLRMTTAMIHHANFEMECGQHALAEEHLLDTLPFLQQSGANVFHASALSGLAWLYHEWRPPHGGLLALKHGQAGLVMARELNHPYALPAALAILASVQAWAADPQEALETAQQAVASAQHTPDERLCLALAAQGRAQRALGQQQAAQASFMQAQEVAQQAGLELEVQRIGLDLDTTSGDTASLLRRTAWYKERDLLGGVWVAGWLTPESLQPQEPLDALGLRLNALGALEVSGAEGRQAVRGELRRKLLVLLLEAKLAARSGVSRLDLIDALYPHQDETAALTSLKVAVFKARSTYGNSLILTTPDGYALGMDSDAELFLATGDAQLWRGPYMGLALGVPSEVQEALHLALLRRAQELLPTAPTEAARLAALFCESDPYHVAGLKLRCQALAAIGQKRALGRVYQQAKALFGQIGEPLPESWTTLQVT